MSQLQLLDISRPKEIIPLKGQLLKWIGNKQRFAYDIVSCFPDRVETYFEPFLGSGAVLATYSPQKGIGSDNFKPLIEIWQKLKESPDTLVEWYQERWMRMREGDKAAVYAEIRDSFNKRPNGADLLFLSRSCYGGVVRFRKYDGYMSTPCGPHTPISPDSFAQRVRIWHERVKRCDFLLLDYQDAIAMAKPGDLIYCDPPYSYSQGILYGAQNFRLDTLFKSIEKCRTKGVNVVLSIDGSKKSGTFACNLEIPKGLFKREVFINVGRSMLKRFQMNGRTLEAERVKDRLLLTY